MNASLATAAESAVRQEQQGYSGVWSAETSHDPFLPLVLAAEHTSTIELGTSIAVAFARNPMTTANSAWDLQNFSEGRFILGLGSQIKPHITKRFSMEWSKPAARMREFILAIRAIWESWETGDRLNFSGDFYTHTLMTPFFNPGPSQHGNARIYLAGVGQLMTEVAGEVADGFICHGFTTERYLREVTLPALDRGRAKAGKPSVVGAEDFQIVGPSFVATGTDDDELQRSIDAVKQQISFYGSTPSYRPVLDLHGWGELQDQLNAMSKRGEWAQMATSIPDEVLHTFAVVGDPESVAPSLAGRYGDVIDRISFYAPYASDPNRWARVMEALQAA